VDGGSGGGVSRLSDVPRNGEAAGGATAASVLATMAAPGGLALPGPEAPAVWEVVLKESSGTGARGGETAGQMVDPLSSSFGMLRDTIAIASGLDADAGTAAMGELGTATMGSLVPSGNTAVGSSGSGAYPVVVYRGSGSITEGQGPGNKAGVSRTVRITGLRPNVAYSLRIRRVGRATASAASKSLLLTTPPMPPLQPAVCEASPQGAVLRWHPAEGGASRYVVEGAIVEALPRGTGSMRASEEELAATRAMGGAAATAVGRAGVATGAAIPSWQLAWTELA